MKNNSGDFHKARTQSVLFLLHQQHVGLLFSIHEEDSQRKRVPWRTITHNLQCFESAELTRDLIDTLASQTDNSTDPSTTHYLLHVSCLVCLRLPLNHLSPVTTPFSTATAHANFATYAATTRCVWHLWVSCMLSNLAMAYGQLKRFLGDKC